MPRNYVPESTIVEYEEIIRQTDLVDDIRYIEQHFESVIKEMISYLNTVDKRSGTRVIADTLNNIELRTDYLLPLAHITAEPHHEEIKEFFKSIKIEKSGDE